MPAPFTRKAAGPSDRPPLSIIIPTLNEEENLAQLLPQLACEPDNLEIIVSDGGSTDATKDLARRFGAIVLDGPAGRGQQLRRGAAAARGRIFWFLHADCRPAIGSPAAIIQALGRAPASPGGNFRLIFDGPSSFAAWLTGFYAWLRRRTFYYGDSGIFVRRGVYEELGGFKPYSIMEDFDFVRRLEKTGPTICIDRPALVTSSRRFHGRKPFWIVWGWLKVHILYFLGVSSAHLMRVYERTR